MPGNPIWHLTTQLDKFTESLLAGRNLGEAAWGATQTLSWMNVVLGDPLYRPFPSHPGQSGQRPPILTTKPSASPSPAGARKAPTTTL